MDKPATGLTPLRIAPLLFGSGFCALIYQVVWMREFRLVFGVSTSASAAVVAIFIGGLGLGGLVLGSKVEGSRRPLQFYAMLEGLIALSAAISPALLWVVRAAYIHLGGSTSMGIWTSTLVRLGLSILALGIPTFLMGGTLSAASRAVEREGTGRSGVALLYGINTLGALLGCLLSTFIALEVFGARLTLWMAATLNLLIAVIANAIGRRAALVDVTPSTDHPVDAPAASPTFVLGSAAVVGCAFFLMEMVWYRMLGPLLGGTVFTFGLILAVALLGMGAGGAVWSWMVSRREATIVSFAYTCLFEALFMIVAYAAGDAVAVLALMLRSFGMIGFVGHVIGWSVVCMFVVFPAAFLSGIQFPMLISLLGRGRSEVGRQVGQTYAWNTLGAIAGTLAGGFGLMPKLTAPGCWRLATSMLVGVGLAALAIAVRRKVATRRLVVPVAAACATIVMLSAQGPTAAWRHSPIGVGRAVVAKPTINSLRDTMAMFRRTMQWQEDGIESSVALMRDTGLSFVVNGKNDGDAKSDAPTQIMSGVLGALLHPNPTRALVIGLGTGSTAGWLADIPTMQSVDVIELEPSIVRVARDCSAVNRNVLNHPKVHLYIGDAREVLLTTNHRYDIIFSEPSNPYRAGVASLFTRDYYEAVTKRLDERGLFLQWIQAYEVDASTLRSVYATMHTVFPVIESWQLRVSDLLLVGSRVPFTRDVAVIQDRLKQEPYRSAAANAWRAVDLEGIVGRFVAGTTFASSIAHLDHHLVNTDDQTFIEYAFARSVGRDMDFSINDVVQLADRRAEEVPVFSEGKVDRERVLDERMAVWAVEGKSPPGLIGVTERGRQRANAIRYYTAGQLKGALAAWKGQPRAPVSITELLVVAETMAEAGDEEAIPYIQQLRGWQATEALAVQARLKFRRNDVEGATADLEAAFVRLRTDPWPFAYAVHHALQLAELIVRKNPKMAPRLFQALKTPFVVRMMDEFRIQAALNVARVAGDNGMCVEALQAFEPHVPWSLEHLKTRVECYGEAKHPLLGVAQRELEQFQSNGSAPFSEGMVF